MSNWRFAEILRISSIRTTKSMLIIFYHFSFQTQGDIYFNLQMISRNLENYARFAVDTKSLFSSVGRKNMRILLNAYLWINLTDIRTFRDAI